METEEATVSSKPVSVVALLLLSRSDRVCSNDVNATTLNGQVHWGSDVAFFTDAESTGVAAEPSIVDKTIYGGYAGPNTEAAHPIKAPLYPHRPFLYVSSSSPINLDVDVAVKEPSAANAARVGSPSTRLANIIRPEVVELRNITCPIARVDASSCSGSSKVFPVLLPEAVIL